MTKKFKFGDKVYHRHLKQFGTFVQYNTLSDDECYVDFVDEDGYTIPDTYVFDSSILPELVQEQYDLSKDGWEIENVEAYEFN